MPPHPIGAVGIKQLGCPGKCPSVRYSLSVCESVYSSLYLLNEWGYFNEAYQ